MARTRYMRALTFFLKGSGKIKLGRKLSTWGMAI
jgi:hypothetical protein